VSGAPAVRTAITSPASKVVSGALLGPTTTCQAARAFVHVGQLDPLSAPAGVFRMRIRAHPWIVVGGQRAHAVTTLRRPRRGA
jgi:hypothetical protein